MNINYLRNNEQDERLERKKMASNLRPESVCVWALNLAPSFLAGKWEKETGWVSWLLSDKEAYQFFSREKPRKALGYKGAEFIRKECTFSLPHTLSSFHCCCLHCCSDLCLVRLNSCLLLCLVCVYVLPLGLKPLTSRKLKAEAQELLCIWIVWRE